MDNTLSHSNGHEAEKEVELTSQAVSEHLTGQVLSAGRGFWLALTVLGAFVALGILGFVVRAMDDGFSDSGPGPPGDITPRCLGSSLLQWVLSQS